MQIQVPPKLRVALYIFTALASPVVAYLLAKGLIGDLEVALWSGEVAIVNVIASLHVTSSTGSNTP